MSNAKNLSELWQYAEAAQYLNITAGTLRRKVMLRQVPFYRPFGKHGRILFDPDDLREFVKASRVEPVNSGR
jgi:excisionase family DNA binding protein